MPKLVGREPARAVFRNVLKSREPELVAVYGRRRVGKTFLVRELFADRLCFELKSLKMYLQRFRNHGVFYEHVTNRILDDLVAAVQPRRAKVVGDFNVRGGIHTVVTVEFPAR